MFLIFDRACEKIGRKFVIGCIWMAILRTGKVRAAGLKYLMKRIDKLKVRNILLIIRITYEYFFPFLKFLNIISIIK